MKNIILFFSLMVLSMVVNAKRPSVLIITGGHNYDTTAFFNMFGKMEGIKYEKILQPQANRAIAEGKSKKYDVLVFYDMWQDIRESEKKGYLKLCRTGKPMIFMHHSLVSYQDWPEFERILGGKYLENTKNTQYSAAELSTYRHDVPVNIKITDPENPVTKGIQDFRLFDEVYGNYRVGKNVIPLLKTDHPESASVIAWEHRYLNSAILYIQPGHDSNSFNDENYSRLIRQAIFFLAHKKYN